MKTIVLFLMLGTLASCTCPNPSICKELKKGGWVHGELYSGDKVTPTKLWVDGIENPCKTICHRKVCN